jgi:hypothetical protein
MERRQARNDEKSIKPGEVLDAWAELYATLPPYPAEGEKIASQIAQEVGVDFRTIKRLIAQWISEGKLIEVGERRSHSGRPGMAYRLK